MVKNYQRKGGHGGARSGAGNKPGHWEAQGGRVAAAIAKVEHGAKAKAEADEAQGAGQVEAVGCVERHAAELQRAAAVSEAGSRRGGSLSQPSQRQRCTLA